MKATLILFAALLPIWSLSAADANAMKHKLVGTWKLVSYIREEIPSGAKSDVMGLHPSGYLIYGNDGRMMVVFVRDGRNKPAGAVATKAEADELFRGLVSYTGTYEVRGDTVVHHVDVSWNQSWTGTVQTRHFKLEGDRLSLSTTPSLDPVEGKMSVRTLIWERVK
jgi:Lipocalin-like domain